VLSRFSVRNHAGKQTQTVTLLEVRMSSRVLVAFGTMSGSTRAVAEAIADEVRKAGHEVEVHRADDIRSTTAFGAVIAGGPVMGGMLVGGVKGLLRRNRTHLRGVPVALFVTCGAMSDPTDANRALADKYLRSLVAAHAGGTPIDTAVFAGGLMGSGPDFDRAFFLVRLMISKLAATLKDTRDLDQVRAWARGVVAKL
jgi:menaquinone-dependent protoporphyrinogen oxidase